jgi:hypothetical protein
MWSKMERKFCYKSPEKTNKQEQNTLAEQSFFEHFLNNQTFLILKNQLYQPKGHPVKLFFYKLTRKFQI